MGFKCEMRKGSTNFFDRFTDMFHYYCYPIKANRNGEYKDCRPSNKLQELCKYYRPHQVPAGQRWEEWDQNFEEVAEFSDSGKEIW